MKLIGRKKNEIILFEGIQEMKSEYNTYEFLYYDEDILDDKVLKKLKVALEEVVVVGKPHDHHQTRIYAEKNVDIIMDPHLASDIKKDYIHHVNSGVNHILAGIIAEKNVLLFFSLNFLFNNDKYERAKILARLNQNLHIARVYKIPVVCDFISEGKVKAKTREEMYGIYSLLKMSTQQVDYSLCLLYRCFQEKLYKRERILLKKGVRVE